MNGVPTRPSPSDLAVNSPRPSFLTWLLIGLVRLYQLSLAGWLGGHCRFTPSCSHYAIACLRALGPWKGALRALGRLSRCHPLCPGGYDPPPTAPPPTA